MAEPEILVWLRMVRDPRPPVRAGEEGALRDPGARRVVNPADLEALDLACRLATGASARVTALTLAEAPAEAKDALRQALAAGAARGVRILVPEHTEWDRHDASSVGSVLARYLRVFEPRMMLAGSRLLDRGDDGTPGLAAALAGLPWIPGVLTAELQDGHLQVLRRAAGGSRHRLRVTLPAALGIASGTRVPGYPDLDSLLGAAQAAIEDCTLADLGLTPSLLPSGPRLVPDGYGLLRPRTRRPALPEADLPVFARISRLLSGGVTPREGALHRGSAEETADALLALLDAEGLLPRPDTPDD